MHWQRLTLWFLQWAGRETQVLDAGSVGLPLFTTPRTSRLGDRSSFLPQVQWSARYPTHTYMRAFELRINTTVISIKLLPPLASKPKVWRLVAAADSHPVASSLTLPNGIEIDRVPGDIGRFGTVKVDAGGQDESDVTLCTVQ